MKLFSKWLISLLLVLPFGFAQAADKEPFTHERFTELQEAGEVVLIDIYATWCSTCAKQHTVLDEYRDINPNKKFTTLVVDFDDQKDVVTEFRAPRQSTLLLYKGEQQFWYSVAETRADVIAVELDKAINFRTEAR